MEVRWSPIYYKIEGNGFKLIMLLSIFEKHKMSSNRTKSLLIVN